jgi:hypothetical protein
MPIYYKPFIDPKNWQDYFLDKFQKTTTMFMVLFLEQKSKAASGRIIQSKIFFQRSVKVGSLYIFSSLL